MVVVQVEQAQVVRVALVAVEMVQVAVKEALVAVEMVLMVVLLEKMEIPVQIVVHPKMNQLIS